jgi:hypothetical protein
MSIQLRRRGGGGWWWWWWWWGGGEVEGGGGGDIPANCEVCGGKKEPPPPPPHTHTRARATAAFHALVGGVGEEVEQVGREGEVVGGLLAREFADDVDGAGDDGGVVVREAALEVVEGEAQALRVLDVELVEDEGGLLADVGARGGEHRDEVANEVLGELGGGDAGEARDGEADLVGRLGRELLRVRERERERG